MCPQPLQDQVKTMEQIQSKKFEDGVDRLLGIQNPTFNISKLLCIFIFVIYFPQIYTKLLSPEAVFYSKMQPK